MTSAAHGQGSHRAPRAAAASASAAVAAAFEPNVSETGRRRSPHRKSALRTLAGSAVLSGAGAVGVTAFVLMAPSGSGHTALATDSDGASAQAVGVPQPTSGQQGGAPMPVADAAATGARNAADAADAANQGSADARIVAAVVTTAPAAGGPSQPAPGAPAAGHLNVTLSQRANNPSVLTVNLWDSGGAPVAWTAAADAPYLRLSSASGVVGPGAPQSVTITVDQDAAPETAWQASVRFDPGGSTIVMHGTGRAPAPAPPPGPGSGSDPFPGPPSGGPSHEPGPGPSQGPTGSAGSPSLSPTASPTTSPSPSETASASTPPNGGSGGDPSGPSASNPPLTPPTPPNPPSEPGQSASSPGRSAGTPSQPPAKAPARHRRRP